MQNSMNNGDLQKSALAASQMAAQNLLAVS
jgi:hypothetical protein